MPLDPVATLAELVRLPSVNPMGRDVSASPDAPLPYYEHRVTAYVFSLLQKMGVAVQRQPVSPLRENVVAILPGTPSLNDGGKLLLLDAHEDTVPVDGMTIDPFAAEIRGDRLYGRGACDVKGGLAMMLAVLSRLKENPPLKGPTVVLSATINEEFGFSGITALPKLWREGSPVLPRKPDFAIVAEPTQLNVVVAHKGAVRWRLKATGRAAHSSQPALGDNAIYRLGRCLSVLSDFAVELSRRPAHALCGVPSLSVGTIRGGISVNTVPDAAEIEIDRRLLPDEEPIAARNEVIQRLARALPSDVDKLEHLPPFMAVGGLIDGPNRELAERLSAAARDGHADRGKIIGVPYGTNAQLLCKEGVPAVVFGPGSIAQAHTVDEYLELPELRAGVDILHRLIASAW